MVCLAWTECPGPPGPPDCPVLTDVTETRDNKDTEDLLDLRESEVCPGPGAGRERTGDTERPGHPGSVPGWPREAAPRRRDCCCRHGSVTVGWAD